jgi:hypothetical protein
MDSRLKAWETASQHRSGVTFTMIAVNARMPGLSVPGVAVFPDAVLAEDNAFRGRVQVILPARFPPQHDRETAGDEKSEDAHPQRQCKSTDDHGNSEHDPQQMHHGENPKDHGGNSSKGIFHN